MAAFRDDIMHNKEEFNNNTGNEYTVDDQVSVEELNYNIENGLYAAKTASEAKTIAEEAKTTVNNGVAYVPQEPTEAQKQQARTNIGAMSKVSTATANNIAMFDANGVLQDSGIIADTDATGIRSEYGNLIKAEDTDDAVGVTKVGNVSRKIWLHGIDERPKYKSSVSPAVYLAKVEDVNTLSMLPSSDYVTISNFNSTAEGDYTYIAEFNGYVRIGFGIPAGATVALENDTANLWHEHRCYLTVSGQVAWKNLYVPCAKGDTIIFHIYDHSLTSVYNQRLYKAKEV